MVMSDLRPAHDGVAPQVQPDDNPQGKSMVKVVEGRQIALSPEEVDRDRQCALLVRRIGH